MKAVLEEDRKRRLGDKYKPINQQPESLKSKFYNMYNKLYGVYRMGQVAEFLRCLKILRKVADNVAANPDSDKFRRIPKANRNFQSKVLNVMGSQFIIQLMGFEDRDQQFYLERVDLSRLREISQHLGDVIEQLSK